MTYKASWTNRIWGVLGVVLLFVLLSLALVAAVAYAFRDW